MRMCLLDLGSRISGSGFGTSLRFSIGMIHFEDLKSRPKRRPRNLGTWTAPALFECIYRATETSVKFSGDCVALRCVACTPEEGSRRELCPLLLLL